MIFSEKYRDILQEMFGHIDIANLVKLRCVSKYLQTLVSNYIRKNEKKCDMMAYDAKFLLTPEYLVIDGTNITKIAIDHINKNHNTLRLVKSIEHAFYSCHLEKSQMLALKYLISDNMFSIENMVIPNIKYYGNSDIDVDNYPIKITCIRLGQNSETIPKYNENVLGIIVDMFSDLSFINYFPNANSLCINGGSCISINDNIQYPNINKLYIKHYRFNIDIIKIFPNLRKIYLSNNIPYIYLKNIKILSNKNKTFNKTNNIHIVENNIYHQYITTPKENLLKLYPKLQEIIFGSKFKFIMDGITIKNYDIDKYIKKIIFI